MGRTLWRHGLVLAALLSLAPTWASAAPACPRACLKGVLDTYLRAVLKHDPAAAALGAGERETQNGVVAAPGEGVWRTASALGSLQRRYLDPVSGQAAYLGLIQENGAPALVSLRLRVVGRRVTEAEWTIARNDGSGLFGEDLLKIPPTDTPLPVSGRASRVTMLAAANSYFEGLTRHDSALVRQNPGCVRIENGMLTAGPALPGAHPMTADCHDKLETMTQISEVAFRRFPLVDEEAGVVLGMGLFHRPPGAVNRAGKPWLRNLLTEYFAVRGGRISGIFAVMYYMPPDAPDMTGWPN